MTKRLAGSALGIVVLILLTYLVLRAISEYPEQWDEIAAGMSIEDAFLHSRTPFQEKTEDPKQQAHPPIDPEYSWDRGFTIEYPGFPRRWDLSIKFKNGKVEEARVYPIDWHREVWWKLKKDFRS